MRVIVLFPQHPHERVLRQAAARPRRGDRRRVDASSDGGVLGRARRLHTNARPAVANAMAARRICPLGSNHKNGIPFL